jgi:hypothetical protein
MTVLLQRPGLTSKLAHWAFVLYVVSYALPAVVIAGDLCFGWLAALLSFFGLLIEFSEGGLEGGQFPACLLGVLANVLMVGAYVCYNLRRFSKKLRPSYMVASRLAGMAATCALGAVVFLATGSESFVPRIGYFAWLASMMLMSFACRQLARVVQREPGAAPNGGPAAPVDSSRPADGPPSVS